MALIYAGVDPATPHTDGRISVLFEIEADTRLSAKPFGFIIHLSNFGSGEDEVLFMVGAMFILVATEYDQSQNLHIFKLKIGRLYEEKGDLNSATEWLEKALNTRISLPPFQSHLYLITARDIALIH
ncbi:unnamed protein product, partial [Rotaria sordida]